MELLESKNIKIGDKEYPVKMTLRSMINFQKHTGKSIDEMSTLEDVTVYFYYTFKAAGSELSYDEFMDIIDDKPDAITAFTDAMTVKIEKKRIAR